MVRAAGPPPDQDSRGCSASARPAPGHRSEPQAHFLTKTGGHALLQHIPSRAKVRAAGPPPDRDWRGCSAPAHPTPGHRSEPQAHLLTETGGAALLQRIPPRAQAAVWWCFSAKKEVFCCCCCCCFFTAPRSLQNLGSPARDLNLCPHQ